MAFTETVICLACDYFADTYAPEVREIPGICSFWCWGNREREGSGNEHSRWRWWARSPALGPKPFQATSPGVKHFMR